MEQIFTDIYKNHIWGDNNNIEYEGSSGIGSSIICNENTFVPFLQQFINKHDINSVVDLGCGDFVCGRLIYDNLNISYTGYDVYKDVVQYNSRNHPSEKYNFQHLDFFSNKELIINSDLCILKDVLQHWSLSQIYTFLDYIVENNKFKYILIVNCDHQSYYDNDISTGDFRPLSCDFLPLKKYNPVKIYNFSSKEISVIRCNPQI